MTVATTAATSPTAAATAPATVRPVTTEPMHMIVDALETLDHALTSIHQLRARALITTGADHLAQALTELDRKDTP